jgi:hypothetical protein
VIAPFLAAAEERWLVPTFASSRAATWIAAHGWLTLPFRIRGDVRRYEWQAGERRCTAITIGAPRRLNRFCDRLVGPLQDVPSAGRQAVWSPARLPAAGTDLVIAEIHRWAVERFRREGWLIVPNVIRWRGELASMPPASPSKSLRDDLRKVRQRHYHLERGDSAADWDQFYATMVVPQAARRFGDAAWIPSAAFWRTIQKTAVLQFICRGSDRVGGLCIVPAGECAWMPLIGTLEGDEALRREGVLAAAYALGIEWAKRHGYRYLDLGRTSGFLQDGIAIYKRKWGLEPVADPLSHVFAVKIGSPAASEAFARDPIWIEMEHGLEAFDGAMP